jgi:hypothetical protein
MLPVSLALVVTTFLRTLLQAFVIMFTLSLLVFSMVELWVDRPPWSRHGASRSGYARRPAEEERLAAEDAKRSTKAASKMDDGPKQTTSTKKSSSNVKHKEETPYYIDVPWLAGPRAPQRHSLEFSAGETALALLRRAAAAAGDTVTEKMAVVVNRMALDRSYILSGEPRCAVLEMGGRGRDAESEEGGDQPEALDSTAAAAAATTSATTPYADVQAPPARTGATTAFGLESRSDA